MNEKHGYILHHLEQSYKLAQVISNRYGIDYDDLRSISHEGLCIAAHRYDITKGKFWQYAEQVITGLYKHYYDSINIDTIRL
jgi:DNA-directed RNA polymerase specialized sigma subunit